MAGGHAVVLGASMGGLLATRVLSDHYDRVTVIERDELPAGAEDRRGVPQGRHVHALLPRAAQILDTLFGGMVDELTAAGAPLVFIARDLRLHFSGDDLARSDRDDTVQPHATRATLEHAVRGRVTALPNVKIIDGRDVIGLVSGDGRVTGARCAHRDGTGAEEVVEADLVVDAMGRSGRSRRWLADLGYPAPQEESLRIDVGYASCFLRLPEGALGAVRGVLCGPVPGCPRNMVLMACEGDRWHFTAGGMAGVHPSGDLDELAAFIEPLAPPDVHAAVRAAERLTEVAVHRFPASVRRRYERSNSLPGGWLAFGDAICSFNPIYGQGMTVAALQALELRRCLELGERDLQRRFFRAAAKIIAPAWRLSAGGDLALPEIEGPRPVATRLINRYVARLQRAGHRDPVVADAFRRVAAYLEPSSTLMSPRVASRVLLARTHSRPRLRHER